VFMCVQASELLLPRIVELRTDCASAATLFRASRRNDRRSDMERLALQLTSTFTKRYRLPPHAVVARLM